MGYYGGLIFESEIPAINLLFHFEKFRGSIEIMNLSGMSTGCIKNSLVPLLITLLHLLQPI